jgi:tRNA U34 2-thiouridine synthase MnmA/TrmU
MRCRYKIRHPGIPKEGNLILRQPGDRGEAQEGQKKEQGRGQGEEDRGEDHSLSLRFDKPERGVAQGQMAAIYNFDGVCLGGGEIYC